MGLIWFLLGLTIGLGFLYGYWQLLSYRVKYVLKKYNLTDSIELSFLSPLAIARSRRSYISAIRSREQAYQRLQHRATTWQQAMQSAPLGYLQVDEENRLFWCNLQACHLLGIDSCNDRPEEQRLLLQLVRSYELDQLVEETRSSQKPTRREWIFHQITPDPLHPIQKQDLPLRCHSVPLADGHIGIFIENCQETASLTQQRDRWASDVAHELKTPLTSIRLIAETLQSRLESSSREWIDRLLNEVVRLGNLVQDLLELGQMDMGKALKLNPKTIDLPKLVYSAWNSLEPLASRKKIRLEYCGENNLILQADESRIYRLLLNLLDNSIKHSPSLQIVMVKVEIGDFNQVQMEIIDSGPGFPEEALPHVFERFYRVDRSRSRLASDQGGSGLGLAIVRQIVQIHHGTIKACNHPETGGGWIIVNLPMQIESASP